jgi:hypothetical protein
MISSVQLSLDNPLNDPNSSIQVIIRSIDYATAAIFGIEAVLKIIAYGFIRNGP